MMKLKIFFTAVLSLMLIFSIVACQRVRDGEESSVDSMVSTDDTNQAIIFNQISSYATFGPRLVDPKIVTKDEFYAVYPVEIPDLPYEITYILQYAIDPDTLEMQLDQLENGWVRFCSKEDEDQVVMNLFVTKDNFYCPHGGFNRENLLTSKIADQTVTLFAFQRDEFHAVQRYAELEISELKVSMIFYEMEEDTVVEALQDILKKQTNQSTVSKN